MPYWLRRRARKRYKKDGSDSAPSGRTAGEQAQVRQHQGQVIPWTQIMVLHTLNCVAGLRRSFAEPASSLGIAVGAA
jgi:hypothetical protein